MSNCGCNITVNQQPEHCTNPLCYALDLLGTFGNNTLPENFGYMLSNGWAQTNQNMCCPDCNTDGIPTYMLLTGDLLSNYLNSGGILPDCCISIVADKKRLDVLTALIEENGGTVCSPSESNMATCWNDLQTYLSGTLAAMLFETGIVEIGSICGSSQLCTIADFFGAQGVTQEQADAFMQQWRNRGILITCNDCEIIIQRPHIEGIFPGG